MNISYYYSLMSPWAYLGSKRFYKLKEKYNFNIIHYPLDIINLFSLSGGEPLSKRAEQRKVYRMMELKRWKEVLNIPINFNPKYFPPSDLIKASCMILALDNEEDQNKLAYKLLEFIWKYEKDIGNDDNLKEACVQCSLDSDKLIILSGSDTDPFGPSPFLIKSTNSIPFITLPNTVYCLSKNGAALKQIKN